MLSRLQISVISLKQIIKALAFYLMFKVIVKKFGT